MANEYNENQIQVLEGLEAVRRRPGMYIGSTSARGLHHLVYEIVANDFDGIIAMADALLAKNAENALAQKVRLQAYASKKDYNKVIELGEAAAKVQTDPEDVSLMYLTLGAAYNAKEMKPQAIEAFRKVTAGPAVESAKAALAELTK